MKDTDFTQEMPQIQKGIGQTTLKQEKTKFEGETHIKSGIVESPFNLNFKGGIPRAHKWQHRNSIKSFKELKPNGRYARILQALKESKIPLTDREIKDKLCLSDLNMVRPRISELVDFGFLLECGKTLDFLTNKTVRIVAINKERQEELF